MKKPHDDGMKISRRQFLGTSAAAGAASIVPRTAGAEPQDAAVAQTAPTKASPPSPEQMAREVGAALPITAMARDKLEQGLPAWQMFVETGLCKSNSDARRLIKQGGGYVGETRLDDYDMNVTLAMAGDDGAIWLRAGKKKHHRVVPA